MLSCFGTSAKRLRTDFISISTQSACHRSSTKDSCSSLCYCDVRYFTEMTRIITQEMNVLNPCHWAALWLATQRRQSRRSHSWSVTSCYGNSSDGLHRHRRTDLCNTVVSERTFFMLGHWVGIWSSKSGGYIHKHKTLGQSKRVPFNGIGPSNAWFLMPNLHRRTRRGARFGRCELANCSERVQTSNFTSASLRVVGNAVLTDAMRDKT